MKAITLHRYGPPELLQLEDCEQPSPDANEVLVRTCAASVNDWDWSMITGKPFFIRLLSGLFRPGIQIPGVDVSGYVEAVGSEVTAFNPGDTVYGDISESGFGAFAEYVCVKENALTKMPDGMSFNDAAAIPHAVTLAMQGLFDIGSLKPHHRLLINGAGGGVGTFAAQIARSIGVRGITGVDHSSKFEVMRISGITECIDYTKTDFTTTDEKYDLILDTRTKRPLSHIMRALTPTGIYSTVGGDLGKILKIALFAPVIHKFTTKRLKVVALKANKDMDKISELYANKIIKPVIDGPYTLSELPDAIKHFEAAKHLGKIIITVHEPEKDSKG